MEKEQFLALVERIRNGQASEEDIRLYNTWFTSFQRSDVWDTVEQGDPEEIKKLISSKISTQIDKDKTRKILKLWPSITVAASILLVLSLGAYLLMLQPKPQQTANNTRIIKPGS